MAQNLAKLQLTKRIKGFYAFDDVPPPGLPSVTTILGDVVAKPALIPWAAGQERETCVETAANMWEEMAGKITMSRSAFITSMGQRLGKTKQHQRKLAKAADIGSDVHRHVEYALRSAAGQVIEPPTPIATEEGQKAFANFLRWYAQRTIRPIFFEQVVRNVAMGYAGTLDLFAETDLRDYPLVIDWKTAKGIYFESAVQTALYAEALRSMGHAPQKVGAMVVRLPKTGTAEVQPKIYSPEEVDYYVETGRAIIKTWHSMRRWANDAGYTKGDDAEEAA